MSLLKVFQSVDKNLSMGFSLRGILLAGWNHVLGGFGVFDHLS